MSYHRKAQIYEYGRPWLQIHSNAGVKETYLQEDHFEAEWIGPDNSTA